MYVWSNIDEVTPQRIKIDSVRAHTTVWSITKNTAHKIGLHKWSFIIWKLIGQCWSLNFDGGKTYKVIQRALQLLL